MKLTKKEIDTIIKAAGLEDIITMWDSCIEIDKHSKGFNELPKIPEVDTSYLILAALIEQLRPDPIPDIEIKAGQKWRKQFRNTSHRRLWHIVKVINTKEGPLIIWKVWIIKKMYWAYYAEIYENFKIFRNNLVLVE